MNRISKIDQTLLSILVSATIFFLISFMLHHPDASPSNYSDIVNNYKRSEVSGQKIPYIDFVFEYPVVSGLMTYLASLAGSMNSYYIVISFFIYFSVLGTVTIVYWLLKEYRMNPNRIFLFCIATPSFIFFSIYTFDWVSIFLGLLSIYLFIKKDLVKSGVFLGLAIATRIIPMLFLPILILNIKDWKKRFLFLAFVAIAWIIPNGYFMINNFDGWLETYKFQYGWGIENSFLIFLFPQIGMGSHYASAFLLLTFLFFIFKKKLHKNVLLCCLAVTLAFMISCYKVPPQYALMLLPFLTVLPVIELPSFHASELSNLLIILMFFSSGFAGENALSAASPVQWINLVRQGLWLLFLIKILRMKKFY